ncbi:hypothetical protein WAE61_01895 [Comamonadaceae bacterium PP-2]
MSKQTPQHRPSTPPGALEPATEGVAQAVKKVDRQVASEQVPVDQLKALLRKWRGAFIEKGAEAYNAKPGSPSLLHIEASVATYTRCHAELSQLIKNADGAALPDALLTELYHGWERRWKDKHAEAKSTMPGSLSLLHIEATADAYMRCMVQLNHISCDATRGAQKSPADA